MLDPLLFRVVLEGEPVEAAILLLHAFLSFFHVVFA